ncbi:MAG: galactokinase [Treponema sp.]|jgi:galactokinase|nr:galactokinase [Treponema sp.]
MIKNGTFESLYSPDKVEEERRRCISLMDNMSLQAGFPGGFSEKKEHFRVFSTPGRTELGGNHTDHNRGKVLAAAIQLDALAVAVPRDDSRVFFRSTGFPDVQVNLDGLDSRPEERETTEALVRGIAAEFARRGASVGGFCANASSMVLPGSGLSSSAAVEVLLAKIFDSLYNGGSCSALELAQISQKSENDFFGKPSGLMDQAASAFGGAVAIDFADSAAPAVTAIQFDPQAGGFILCVVNTRGSHADLTPDYAAVPQEMNAVARYFGKSFLRETDYSQVLAHAGELRKSVGDRALLRAIHFFNENRRVTAMAGLLQKLEKAATDSEKQGFMGQFLDLVNESGDSSWELLQNLYSPRNFHEQGLSLALAVSREFFREQGMKAACRVHGGGFAGTVQAYIPVDGFKLYCGRMEALFGPGAVTVLRIRQAGAVEIMLDL